TDSIERTPAAPAASASDADAANVVGHSQPAGPPPPPGAQRPRTAEERAIRAAAAKEAPIFYSSSSSSSLSEDGSSQAGISESSSFSLVLRGDALDRARAEASALYRRELDETDGGRSAKSRAGKHSWFQRSIAAESWSNLREILQRQLTGERLLQWQNWCMAHARGFRKAGERMDSDLVRGSTTAQRIKEGTWYRNRWHTRDSPNTATTHHQAVVQMLLMAYRALQPQVTGHLLEAPGSYTTNCAAQAEAAARKGNHRDLFLIARRLGPKTAQGVSRLQGSDGRVLDSSAEMAAIIKHSQATFAATPDNTDLQPLQAGLTFSTAELQAALDALNIRKAVPRHIAPNAVWKLCATSVGAHLGPCFERHFRPQSTDLLDGNVASQILEHLQPMLDHMPQFAYCAGLCLSLDLSSAFDSVSRDLLIQSLLDHQVPSDLINVIQQLHRGAKYIFRTSQARGQVTTTNGIKQGCRAAPTLWVSFTLSVLEHLARHRSLMWVQNILTLFADDFCGHWTITCLQDWTAAISDLTLLMETLETYQLRVNLQKTALLVNLKGKTAKKLLRQHTRQKAGDTFLILQVHGREKILNGRGPLSIKYRLRLVKLCACRDPANQPLGPDLINNDNVIIHLNHLLDCFQEALRGLTAHSLTSPEEAQPCPNPGFPCQFCDLVLPTSHARLIHSAIKHPEQEPVIVDATARAYAGAESQELAAQNAVPLISADIFAHCMPSGAAETGAEQDSQLRLISKLLLKHEEQLAALRKDTQFVLFFRQDDKSILPSLMNVSREWKAKQAAGDQSIQSSQRTVLINCLLRELLARMQRVVATEPGRESLKKAEWLTSSNAWTYMRWSPKLRKLVADETKEPLVHDEAVRIITELQKSMRGEIIHKFQSTINLAKLEEQGAQQAIFHLAVSLRGSEATEVYDQFRQLAGLSLTNLAGFSMKVDDQLRPPMAQQLAQMTYGG
ncbi:Pol, partial [Symbiodinium necroappetens]